MKFDQFYWPKDKDQFSYCSGDADQYFSSWTNVGRHADQPILASYQTGKHARDFNQWSDGDLIEKAMDVLQKMFGELSAPISYVRTNWLTDPFSRGSYSFDRVGQLPEDRRTLAAPVGDRLFFAGEATHPYYYGTVHSAYETGIRAAQEVISLESS